MQLPAATPAAREVQAAHVHRCSQGELEMRGSKHARRGRRGAPTMRNEDAVRDLPRGVFRQSAAWLAEQGPTWLGHVRGTNAFYCHNLALNGLS